MADIGKFFGGLFGSAASGIASPAAQVVDGASKIIGMFKLSPELKAQLQAQLTAENIDLEKAQLAAELAAVQGQLDIDKQEAASTNAFIAGWRPFIGWVCGTALAWEFVLKPFLQFALVATHHPLMAPLPALDTGTLIAGLLAPMLGLGGMRSLEKIQGAPGASQLQ
jgi:hypothetical protein